MRAGAPGPTARGRLFARELGRSLRWEKAVKNPVDKFCRMPVGVGHGRTSRGDSGALFLQPASAGMNPGPRTCIVLSDLDKQR